jgi:multiple sugar transport system permease protein
VPVLVTFRRLGMYALLIVVALGFLIPPLWMVLGSLKTEAEYSSSMQIFPAIPQWSNYIQVFTLAPFFKYALNSVILLAITVPTTTLVSSLVGYAFARLNAPGKNLLFGLIVSTLTLPALAIAIPQFVLYSRLGFLNTYWPWILSGLSGNAFHIFLYRQFFASFPRELEDAAEVDGCNRLQIFWKIYLPNSGPVIATSVLLLVIMVWGDYFTPALYLGLDKAPLSFALFGPVYVDPRGRPLVMVRQAAMMLYALPMIVTFFVGQRYLLQSALRSGLKG